jgi:hypothetical protein
VNGSRRTIGIALHAMVAFALLVFASGVTAADSQVLKLRATVIGVRAPAAPLTIELFRWPTDEERAPLIAAFSAPPPPAPAAAAAGAAGGRAAGRGGRGGRAAAPPPSPIERLTTAVKAAPTCGFIWSDGPTGYSVKYAWRVASPDGAERIVLVTDRRLGANDLGWPAGSGPGATADFTVIEMRLAGKGTGEAKASISAPVVVDAAARTLALDGYAAAPALLKVTR